VDADPHHGEANHGTRHSGPKEKDPHHQQNISLNYDLCNSNKYSWPQVKPQTDQTRNKVSTSNHGFLRIHPQIFLKKNTNG